MPVGRKNPSFPTSHDRLYQPTPREAAMTILHLLDARVEETDRKLSRARLSQTTVRKLCGRGQVSIEFLEEVREILLAAGWCFFCAGASHYAVVKVTNVEGWTRTSSKRIISDLELISRGRYDFSPHEQLLLIERRNESDDEEKAQKRGSDD